MFNCDELFLKCLELTKNDAYTRNVTMWCQAADGLYTFIKTKRSAELASLKESVAVSATSDMTLMKTVMPAYEESIPTESVE